MHPHDKRLQFIEFRSKGWSINRISETIDVPKSTLCDWQKQDKARIDELREMEQEALEEQFTEQREYEYQKLSSRLDLVERALDQQLQEKVATLSLMELCRLSSALRSQLGKLERPTARPLKAAQAADTQPVPKTAPSPSCEAAECLLSPDENPDKAKSRFIGLNHQSAGASAKEDQPSANFETGHFRTEPDIPSVRKDSLPPQPTETTQKEAPPAPPDIPAAATPNDSHAPTETEPPTPPLVTAQPVPSPATTPAMVIPERMVGGIIDPKRIIGRRCSMTSAQETRQ